jgi:TctA family transporter
VEILSGLAHGFGVALEPTNLLWCFVGVFLGTVVGVLPGLGPPATVAMLLPLTFHMNPAGAIIMLAGIYYGAKYGGSTTSILMNVPGESASVITCLDGYQMARKGRAGAALGIAAISSFVAGTVGVVGLMLVAPPVARFALSFSSPEYFGLMSLGLALVVLLAGRSLVKALLAALLGLWISTMGTDLFSATSRFTFGRVELLSGIDFIVVAIGVFALGEVFANMEKQEEAELLPVPKGLKNLLPTLQDLKDCRFAFVNGSVVGFLVGALPGGGSTIASFLSYGLEKAVSRRREQFGTGVIEGVAAPEGANNSETGGARAAADARHPGLGHHRDPARRAGAVGIQAGTAVHRGEPGALLGTGREHVHRQRDAARAESAARAALRPGTEDARVHSLSPDPGRVAGRRLQRLGQHVRSAAPDHFRAARLPDAQARFSGCAAHPGPRTRRRDGARAAPVAHDVGRRDVDPGV